jgi:hypothetical protein
MRHHDAAGEEVQAVLEAARQLPVLHVEVFRVADDRVADMGGMRPELMGAPRHRLQGQPGKLLGHRFDHGVVGERVARALLAMPGDAHPGIPLPPILSGKVGRDPALPDPGHAGDERPIDLPGRAGAEGLGERHRREPGLGDDEAARRVLVEPVDEPRLLARLVAQRLEQAVDVPLGARAALDGEAVGLVEHQHVSVLVKDDGAEEGAILVLARGAAGGGFRRVELQRGDADGLAGLETVARVHALAVHPQLALPDDALDVGEGELGEAGEEETVHPHPGLVRLDGERLDAGGEGCRGRRARFALRRRALSPLGGGTGRSVPAGRRRRTPLPRGLVVRPGRARRGRAARPLTLPCPGAIRPRAGARAWRPSRSAAPPTRALASPSRPILLHARRGTIVGGGPANSGGQDPHGPQARGERQKREDHGRGDVGCREPGVPAFPEQRRVEREG